MGDMWSQMARAYGAYEQPHASVQLRGEDQLRVSIKQRALVQLA